MKKKKILQKTKRKEIKNVITIIGIFFLALPLLAFSYNRPAFDKINLEAKEELSLKTGDVFSLDLFFNDKVKDVYYDVTTQNLDNPDEEISFIKKYYDKKGNEVPEGKATYAKKLKYGYTVKKIINSTGKYKVHMRNINSNLEYDTIVNITDGMGPTLITNDNVAINSQDFLAIDTFVSSCSDSSSECNLSLLDENGNEVEEFNKSEGKHSYVLRANDDLGNITSKTISYEINNTLPINRTRIYRSASGFTSDNPILRDALTYVGRSGLNCEQLFQLVIRNNKELYEKTGGDINSVRHQVDLMDIKPGDELRYVDGGWGMIHVAIYLGDGLAVHGGFHGTDVVIFDAFPVGSTVPTVYHYDLD